MIPRWLRAYVDGGVFGTNPSSRGIYWSVLIEDAGEEVALIRKQSVLFRTNSDAEWCALREALQWAVEHQIRQPLVIYSDSQFVVKQFSDTNRVHIERHIRMYYECKRLVAQLPWVAVQMPPRPKDAPETWRPRDVMLEKLGH